MNPKSIRVAKLGRMIMKGGWEKESVLVIENKRVEGGYKMSGRDPRGRSWYTVFDGDCPTKGKGSRLSLMEFLYNRNQHNSQ